MISSCFSKCKVRGLNGVIQYIHKLFLQARLLSTTERLEKRLTDCKKNLKFLKLNLKLVTTGCTGSTGGMA